jgi:predicted small metal-binding protein
VCSECGAEIEYDEPGEITENVIAHLKSEHGMFSEE